jgi:hypothetical protein
MSSAKAGKPDRGIVDLQPGIQEYGMVEFLVVALRLATEIEGLNRLGKSRTDVEGLPEALRGELRASHALENATSISMWTPIGRAKRDLGATVFELERRLGVLGFDALDCALNLCCSFAYIRHRHLLEVSRCVGILFGFIHLCRRTSRCGLWVTVHGERQERIECRIRGLVRVTIGKLVWLRVLLLFLFISHTLFFVPDFFF